MVARKFLLLTSSAMGAILSKPRDPTEKECHGYNCKWDNGIFTPSSNSEGEVASIPLKQREEQRQAFSKEEVAGNMLHNKWDNGILTPSFNREGEVASIRLLQREEKRQAFSKEGVAGKQGGTDNLKS